ncbi:MAG: hypothetical protein DIU76_04110 [Bacillota bacterium]|nr:MAG: hypothetical protein DIU76_04110 [Bacillota bacterium]
MENPDAFVELVATAKAFGQRPSSFVSGLSGYEAYCFDVAAALALAYLEQGKQPAVDARVWLGGPRS